LQPGGVARHQWIKAAQLYRLWISQGFPSRPVIAVSKTRNTITLSRVYFKLHCSHILISMTALTGQTGLRAQQQKAVDYFDFSNTYLHFPAQQKEFSLASGGSQSSTS